MKTTSIKTMHLPAINTTVRLLMVIIDSDTLLVTVDDGEVQVSVTLSPSWLVSSLEHKRETMTSTMCCRDWLYRYQCDLVVSP